MPDDQTTNEGEPTAGAIFSHAEYDELVATVVEYGEVPDECTIHPINATEEELMTRWVTALQGSFVSVEDAR